MTRQIIHSMGERFRWQLAVCGDDVTTSRHLPTADGSTYYTTADFGLTTRDAGEDGLSPYQVVARYHDRAADAPAFPELLEATRAALRGETPEATAGRRVATDGGVPESGDTEWREIGSNGLRCPHCEAEIHEQNKSRHLQEEHPERWGGTVFNQSVDTPTEPEESHE